MLRDALIWFDRQIQNLQGTKGPYYLVVNMKALIAAHFRVLKWCLDGAIQAFEDRDRKALFNRIREAIDRAALGEEIDWPAVLGFDLKELFNPAPPPGEAQGPDGGPAGELKGNQT